MQERTTLRDCKICGKQLQNYKGLSYHVRTMHGMSSEDYLIEHEYDGIRPTCACGCGNPVSFFCGLFVTWYKSHGLRGRRLSVESRRKISTMLTGGTQSPESNQKRSIALLEHHATHPEHAVAISAANLGNVHTPEHNKRISVSRKAGLADGSIVINRDA